MLRYTLPLLLPLIDATANAQRFVVCNRTSRDVTVHRAVDGHKLLTVPMPPAANPSEPMYVVSVGGEVIVGDRGNNRVVRFDRQQFGARGEAAVGNGVFHMWSRGDQLWVNCDIDRTTVVLDTNTWQPLATVPIPADLAAQGYKPHDVFAGDCCAWVSLIGGSGATDWVVQTSTSTFRETGRVAVGKDPHLWWNETTNRLYVPAQNGNRIEVLDGTSLQPIASVPQPGAHGVFQPRWCNQLLVTNITGAGIEDLVAYRVTATGLTPSATASSNILTAHNITALPFGLRIAVTHSGPVARKVSLYRMLCLPWSTHVHLVRLGDVDAGVNPFGITMIP